MRYEEAHARIAALEAEVTKLKHAADKEERSSMQLLQERDAAEEAVSHAYYLVTGRSPEWSNHFGHAEAHEEIQDAVNVLREEAKKVPTLEAELAKEREAVADLRAAVSAIPRKLPDELMKRGMHISALQIRSAINALTPIARAAVEGGGA